ncbi:MAG TPA: hypothetical protein DIW64_11260 [Cellvibrio sp.]|nr:hypothetical protein [Cellvibrio sp.]
MSSTKTVIIANGINGLGAVRSAAIAGLEVITILSDRNDLAAHSRYAKVKYYLPADARAEDLYQLLLEIYEQHGAASIISCSDFSVEMVAEIAPKLVGIHYVLAPSAHTVQLLNDKKYECLAMAEYGVMLPDTVVNLAEDMPSSFPALIKPRSHRDYTFLGAKNRILHNEREWLEFKSQYATGLDRFISQEIITGQDSELWVCNVTFNKQSELVSCFVFQRLGTSPSHYGVTSLALSCENSLLMEECRKIGVALGYMGPAMIEFKRCPVRNKFFYIETNPRIGMCNWFDTRCGINNILTSHKVAQNEPVALGVQKNGMLFINLSGDFIARMEDRESIFSVFFLYFRHLLRTKVGATFYWKDPWPGVRYSYNNLRMFVRRSINFLRK